jgi:hypothetical protein
MDALGGIAPRFDPHPERLVRPRREIAPFRRLRQNRIRKPRSSEISPMSSMNGRMFRRYGTKSARGSMNQAESRASLF